MFYCEVKGPSNDTDHIVPQTTPVNQPSRTEDPDQIPEWAVDELELELVGEAPKAAFSSLYALDS